MGPRGRAQRAGPVARGGPRAAGRPAHLRKNGSPARLSARPRAGRAWDRATRAWAWAGRAGQWAPSPFEHHYHPLNQRNYPHFGMEFTCRRSAIDYLNQFYSPNTSKLAFFRKCLIFLGSEKWLH